MQLASERNHFITWYILYNLIACLLEVSNVFSFNQFVCIVNHLFYQLLMKDYIASSVVLLNDVATLPLLPLTS